MRAHTCVAVRAKKTKNFQTVSQKQQPHRPFLRSRVAVRAKKNKKTFKPRARNNNHTGCSFALACPYVHGRTCQPKIKIKKTFEQPHMPFLRSRVPVRACPYVRGHTCVAVRANQKKQKKQLSNNRTGRSFALVNDDWIGALCLSINAHKKSRNY